MKAMKDSVSDCVRDLYHKCCGPFFPAAKIFLFILLLLSTLLLYAHVSFSYVKGIVEKEQPVYMDSIPLEKGLEEVLSREEGKADFLSQRIIQ